MFNRLHVKPHLKVQNSQFKGLDFNRDIFHSGHLKHVSEKFCSKPRIISLVIWKLGWFSFWMYPVQISWDVKVLHTSVSMTRYSGIRPPSPCSCKTNRKLYIYIFWKFPWHVHLFISRYTKLPHYPALRFTEKSPPIRHLNFKFDEITWKNMFQSTFLKPKKRDLCYRVIVCLSQN
jgi:hypothetical protein